MCDQVKGEAEAFAIEAKARAEAEQMAKKADAWKDYQDAAMVDMVLETLPKVRRRRVVMMVMMMMCLESCGLSVENYSDDGDVCSITCVLC